jgi:GDPmannose 4,6-dehydratase
MASLGRSGSKHGKLTALGKALVLGVDGQDGSYLAELLLERGCQVVGWIPENVPVSLENLCNCLSQIKIVQGSLSDQVSLDACLEEHRPDQIYCLAAPSAPFASWEAPLMTGDIAALGVVRLLEAVRRVVPQAHLYQASSSELFGDPVETPQSETTPFHPRNPYGIAKLYAHWMTVRYRERYGLFTVSGILFNHESPRRGLDFVTRKISHTAARIKLGLENELHLGDLDAHRDWGFAGDYVRAMCMMLEHDTPHDLVIGTGQTHSVREFCELAFGYLDLDYRKYVIQDKRFMRPPETAQLVADPRKAWQELSWQPQVTFAQLVRLMVEADLCSLADAHEKD